MKSTTLTLIIGLGFLIGCGPRVQTSHIIKKYPIQKVQPKQNAIKKNTIKHTVTQSKLPPAPKKVHRAKAVEDTNYSDQYMYPDDGAAAKKDPVITKHSSPVPTSAMNKETCINMIGQEKFDKYTAMFGSEVASIKRCTMLKAMQK